MLGAGLPSITTLLSDTSNDAVPSDPLRFVGNLNSNRVVRTGFAHADVTLSNVVPSRLRPPSVLLPTDLDQRRRILIQHTSPELLAAAPAASASSAPAAAQPSAAPEMSVSRRGRPRSRSPSSSGRSNRQRLESDSASPPRRASSGRPRPGDNSPSPRRYTAERRPMVLDIDGDAEEDEGDQDAAELQRALDASFNEAYMPSGSSSSSASAAASSSSASISAAAQAAFGSGAIRLVDDYLEARSAAAAAAASSSSSSAAAAASSSAAARASGALTPDPPGTPDSAANYAPTSPHFVPLSPYGEPSSPYHGAPPSDDEEEEDDDETSTHVTWSRVVNATEEDRIRKACTVPYCTNVPLNGPHMPGSCRHSLCRPCLDQLVRSLHYSDDDPKCPSCSVLIRDKAPSQIRNDILATFKVRCINHRAGCKEIISLANGGKHELEHRNKCSFRLVKCDKCNLEYRAKDVEDHNNICPKRMVNCSLCQLMVPFIEIKTHQTSPFGQGYCQSHSLCPNRCFAKGCQVQPTAEVAAVLRSKTDGELLVAGALAKILEGFKDPVVQVVYRSSSKVPAAAAAAPRIAIIQSDAKQRHLSSICPCRMVACTYPGCTSKTMEQKLSLSTVPSSTFSALESLCSPPISVKHLIVHQFANHIDPDNKEMTTYHMLCMAKHISHLEKITTSKIAGTITARVETNAMDKLSTWQFGVALEKSRPESSPTFPCDMKLVSPNSVSAYLQVLMSQEGSYPRDLEGNLSVWYCPDPSNEADKICFFTYAALCTYGSTFQFKCLSPLIQALPKIHSGLPKAIWLRVEVRIC